MGPDAQTEHLATAVCYEFLGIERKPHLLGVLRDDQSDRQRAFSVKGVLRRESRQFLLVRARNASGRFILALGIADEQRF